MLAAMRVLQEHAFDTIAKNSGVLGFSSSFPPSHAPLSHSLSLSFHSLFPVLFSLSSRLS